MLSDSEAVRIVTGARLHFGLLDTVTPFGGLGVMVDDPTTEVVVTPQDRLECEREIEPRVLPIAERATRLGNRTSPLGCRVNVARRTQAHFGLGSGTQLALAVAEGICRCAGIEATPGELAVQIAGRGKRSAVGIHGYFAGGLIYECGAGSTATSSEFNAIEYRAEIPGDWCVGVFCLTDSLPAVSGDREREQFANLVSLRDATARLQALITEQILPAVANSDFPTFATAVQAYNHASGKLFESVQGGPYNGAAVTRVVRVLSDLGAAGVGQSSWGPGVFAWFPSRAAAEEFLPRLPPEVSVITLTHPRNTPRELEIRSNSVQA